MIALSTYAFAILLFPVLVAVWYLRKDYASGFIGLLGLLAAGVLIAVSATLPHLFFDHERYLHDLWTAFDTANKSASGQASSVDYFSPIGPVYDWVFRIAVELRPQDATSVPLASAIFGLGTFVLAVLTLTRQVSFGTLGLVLLVAVATVVTPREPDMIFAQTSMSWLAPYNRWAAALAAVVTVAFCCPPGRRGVLEAFLLGFSIAVVFLIKVTFGAALVGLLVAATVFRNVSIKHAVVVLIGLAASLAAAELVTGQVSANLADIKTVSGFAKETWRIIKLITQLGEAAVWAIGSAVLYLLLCENSAEPKRFTPVVLILVAAAMACVILMQNHWLSESPVYAMLPIIAAQWAGLFRKGETAAVSVERQSKALTLKILSVLTIAIALITPVVLILVAAAMACVILMQNHWLSESPVYAMLPIIAAQWAGLFRKGETAAVSVERQSKALTLKILSVLTIAIALIYPARDGGAMVAQFLQSRQYPADERLANTGQAGFVLHPRWLEQPDEEVTVDYNRMLDGFSLLQEVGAADPDAGPVLALNFANPFPALLNKPSPARVPIWFHNGRTFSKEIHQPEEEFFSDAEFVILGHGDPSGEALWEIYRPYVQEHYEEAASSPSWTVYRKKVQDGQNL